MKFWHTCLPVYIIQVYVLLKIENNINNNNNNYNNNENNMNNIIAKAEKK